MRSLNKIFREAKIENKPYEQALIEFLRNHNDTPHSSTGFSPNSLFFNLSAANGGQKLSHAVRTSQPWDDFSQHRLHVKLKIKFLCVCVNLARVHI